MILLVTGAARGIGRELVRQYLADGATVVAATRNPAPDLANLPGGHLIPLALDAASPESIHAAARALEGRVPHLDALFNNAATLARADHFADFSLDAFLDVIRVNTAGPVLVARAFLPFLKAAPHGRVLTLTSRTGILPPTPPAKGGAYGYCASKAAMHRLLPLLAADLQAEGVTSVGVNPGFVETDVTRGHAAGRHLLSAETSVRGIRQAAAALTPAHAGCLLRWDGALCRWFPPPETEEDLQIVPPVLPEPFVLQNP